MTHAALVTLLAVVIVHCPGAANAQKAKENDKKVKVTVVVILASDGAESVDERLTWIAKEVQKREPKLKNFKLTSMESRSLAVAEDSYFKLVDGKEAKVVVKHCADPQNKVGIAVTPPEQSEIVYRCICGKFLPIVTRYRTAKRERLILAIRVQPCKGD